MAHIDSGVVAATATNHALGAPAPAAVALKFLRGNACKINRDVFRTSCRVQILRYIGDSRHVRRPWMRCLIVRRRG